MMKEFAIRMTWARNAKESAGARRAPEGDGGQTGSPTAQPQGQHGREDDDEEEKGVASAEPMPKFWMLALWLPKAVR